MTKHVPELITKHEILSIEEQGVRGESHRSGLKIRGNTDNRTYLFVVYSFSCKTVTLDGCFSINSCMYIVQAT